MSIDFNDRHPTTGRMVRDGVILHTTEDGLVAGIELLAVSRFASNVDELIEKYDIRKVRAAEQAKAQTK